MNALTDATLCPADAPPGDTHTRRDRLAAGFALDGAIAKRNELRCLLTFFPHSSSLSLDCFARAGGARATPQEDRSRDSHWSSKTRLDLTPGSRRAAWSTIGDRPRPVQFSAGRARRSRGTGRGMREVPRLGTTRPRDVPAFVDFLSSVATSAVARPLRQRSGRSCPVAVEAPLSPYVHTAIASPHSNSELASPPTRLLIPAHVKQQREHTRPRAEGISQACRRAAAGYGSHP